MKFYNFSKFQKMNSIKSRQSNENKKCILFDKIIIVVVQLIKLQMSKCESLALLCQCESRIQCYNFH